MALGILRQIRDPKSSSNTDSKPVKPIILERLEPRILLSGDGLLYAAAPDPLLDSTQSVVQYAVLLETNEQVEQQLPTEWQEIHLQLDSSDSLNADLYQPIFTLSLGDEATDTNLNSQDIGPAQTDTELAVSSDDSEEIVDSKSTAIEIVDVEEPTTNSPAVPIEDSSMPIYISDADLSIEYATSIEIRGPPADTGECSTTSDLSTYATSGEIVESSDVEGLHQLNAPALPSLVLVDPNISSWEGQIIYLDFDGEQDVTYNGPVIIEDINIPEFSTDAAGLAGQEQAIISQILSNLERQFEGTGVLFTTYRPDSDTSYSTIYVGGDDSAFAEYGSFLGLAEKVDIGNQDRSENGFVFGTNTGRTAAWLGGYLGGLTDLVAHEVGHLLGYQHGSQGSGIQPMLQDVAYGVDTHYEIVASASALYSSLFGVSGVAIEHESYLSSWKNDDDDDGESLREGVVEEDMGTLGTRPLNHYSAGGDGDELFDGLNLGGWVNTPYENANETRYPNAVSNYNSGEKAAAYYWLGRTMHLLQDSTLPAHVHKDEHGVVSTGDDRYEETAYDNRSYFIFSGLSYWDFQDWGGDWSSPSSLWNRSDDYSSLLSLFRETTDYADDYDSDDAPPGDWHNNISGDYFSITRLNVLDRSHHDNWANENVNSGGFDDSELTSTEVLYLARDLGTWAVEQSAMLLRYFYDDLGEVVSNPSNMHIDDTSSSSIQVDWDSVSGSDGYVVYRSTYSGSGFSRVGSTSASSYNDTGLSANTNYYYRVFAYDDIAGLGSVYSSTSATTDPPADTTPPTPNPSTWSTQPYATGPYSISMTATTASDPNGVQYYFDETSGNPGGTDSGWQDSRTYQDTGLSANTSYTYRVMTRDGSANQNTGSYSSSRSATTGLLSSSVPIFKVPNSLGGDYPDISGSWIVWAENRYGNNDIFAYNIATGEERQITTDPASQWEAKISGDLIVWTDWRNDDGSRTNSDIYGYNIAIGQEFVVSTDSTKEEVIGVDNGKVAFLRAYHVFSEESVWDTARNLWLFNYDTGLSNNITGFSQNGLNPMGCVGSYADFGNGLLVWAETTLFWQTEYSYWDTTDPRTQKMRIGVDTQPVRILNRNFYISADNNRFVYVNDYEDPDSYSGEQVFIWDNGSIRRLTSPGTDEKDYASDILALGGDFVVYSDNYPSEGILYYDLKVDQQFLLTEQLSDSEEGRMDGNGIVWRGQDPSDSQWYIYYAFLQQPDIAISSAHLTFSSEDAVEGDAIDVSILVCNLTDYSLSDNITVRLYDGDPDAGGEQLGSDQIISGGLSGTAQQVVEFPGVIIPEGAGGTSEETVQIYIRISVPSFDNPDNNTAMGYLTVYDDDTVGPLISDVSVVEYNGDGDGIIGADEQIRISWNLSDPKGIDSTDLLVDGSPISMDGDYYAIFGPLDAGEHSFVINATDADTSPASSDNDDGFSVFAAEEITILYEGVSIVDDSPIPIDVGDFFVGELAADVIFIIRNDGEQTLTLGDLVIQITQGNVTCNNPVDTSIQVGGTTYFTITPDTSTIGPFVCDVSLANSDSDENPFNFSITGTVMDADTLLYENFDDGNYDGWIPVDQGTVDGPMSWSAASGSMVQSSNVYTLPGGTELPKKGTYAWYTAGTGWTDYKTTVTIESADDDAIGIMFRYQDVNNYYRFSWDKQRSYRRLIKRVNGQFTLLAQDSVPYNIGQDYQLEITAQGGTLQVSIDGSSVFSVTDSALSSGTIGLYCWGNVGSYFDDIVVEKLNRLPVISSITATPSTISDEETSQLQVSVEPDDGPDALAYSWTVEEGEGSLSDASIANPVYTPPDVGSTQTFTITVEVSDGEDTTISTVDITVTDSDAIYLLDESFNDGNYSGWSLVNQGTVDGPMSWSAASGSMVQSSNVYSLPGGNELPKPGTYAWYTAGTGWTDYKTTVTIESADDDAIGIMFRYQDVNNYYRFSWDKQRGYRRLVKCVNGKFTLLAEDSVPYVTGQDYQLEITAQGSTLQVSIDGSLVFSVTDSALSSGTIGLYCWGNVGSYFDDIVVEDLS